MKVAILTYGYGCSAYGMGKYSFSLTNELQKLGAKIDVFTIKRSIRKIGPFLFYAKNGLINLREYDIVQSNEGAGLFINHPKIIETYHHNYFQLGFWYSIFGMLELYQCRRSNHVIVPSFATKQALISQGLTENHISVIHHGVSSIFKMIPHLRQETRAKLGLSNKFVVISVGRIVQHKRHMDIVEAVSRIPNAIFILVGKGNLLPEIQTLAQKKQVFLLHFENISDAFLVALLNASDVYVHASEIEGFGLSVLEALACGIPVVAYKTADFRQIIGNAGFLLDQGNIDGMHESLLLLSNNELLRKELGCRATEFAKNFTWNKTAKKYLDLYEKMIKEGA